MDGLDAMLENGPWFIQNNPFILKKWHPNENLLKEDVSTIPVWVKLHGVHVTAFSDDGLSVIATKLGTPLMLDTYTSDMSIQSWGRSSYARVMIELRADVELKDNIVVAMPKIKRGATILEISVLSMSENPLGQKMGFKPKQVFQPVSKNSTANTVGKKKNNSKSTNEVSKSNPFEVLTSVDNDVDFGKLRISTSDKDGSDKGYGTNSLLEQWRNSYPDNNDYDPYDDDMYENHDLSQHLQSICDDLDIMVRGRKKK
ncbi:putative reverse transcriptase domain-containing protein [Tanacetum coccineum]